MALGWKGLKGEDDMNDQDWTERARLAAVGMIGGTPAEECVPDDDGDPTFGCYNGDYTQEEHERANQRYEQDAEYREAADDGARKLNYIEQEFL